MAIRIITDTSADLSQEIINKYHIIILPLIVLEGDHEYVDTIDITAKEIYHQMREGKTFKTAQLSVSTMLDAFTSYAKTGDDIIFMPLSKGISGTYNTAYTLANQFMEEHPQSNIIVWDTLGTSGGLGLLVYETAKDIAAGKSLEEVLDHLKFNSIHMQYLFTVDDIEYLHRGGRVNGIEKVLGSLFQIKPILHVNRLGQLVPLAKVRGKHKSYAKIIDFMKERLTDPSILKDSTIFISHGDVEEDALKLKKMVIDEFGVENFEINILSATVGVHTGPGLMSIYFIDKAYHQMGDGENIKEEDILR